MGYLLIIGAKSEIAKSLAKKYAENGYNLYLAARQVSDLNDFATDLSIRTQKIIQLFDLDVLDFASHEIFYNTLEEKPGGVIAVAGYLGSQEKAQIDFYESEKIIDTNFTGIVSLLNIFANDFEQRKSGFIVGISSVAGDRGKKSNYLYGSAKAALTTYLSGLRNRLATENVQVLTVKPGFVDTPMTEGMDLPEKLTTQPGNVAEDIFQAQQNGKDILYTKKIWRFIMLVIRAIPEWKFKRMSL